MIRRFATPLSFLVLALGACSESYAPPEFASIAIASGNQQAGKICTVMSQPLVVTAYNNNGKEMPGARIHFAAAAGTIDVGSPITGADGKAKVNYTMPTTPGAYTVEVLGITAGQESHLTFNLIAEPNPPSVLRRISGNAQTGVAGATLSTSMLARVSDNCGVPFKDVTVNWTAKRGTLLSQTTVTDSLGNTTNRLTLPATAGVDTVTASANGYTSIIFTATATAPVVVP